MISYSAALFNTAGVAGALLALLAYFLLYLEKIRSDDLYYPLLNTFASILILFSLSYAWNVGACIMETCWLLISVSGLWKNYKKHYA